MRINEYNNLDEFIYEYGSGIRDLYPKNGGAPMWEGLEFCYKKEKYRLCHAPMYEMKPPILEDGREGKFLLAKQISSGNSYDYSYLGWFSCMDDLLNSTLIDGRKFSYVIMDDNTEILAKD